MLASRVIPIMLCKSRQLVRGKQFVNDRVIGVALQAARVHASRGVDELLIIDVAAAADGRTIDLGMIEELTDGIFVPVTVGGGVRTVEQIRALLKAGADKVLVGSKPSPAFLFEAWQTFGSQAIVASVDDLSLETAQRHACGGAGELLLNNPGRDGTMQGYNLDLIRKISSGVPVPVIACGGCSSYADMANALEAGASAVAAGALFAFEDATPKAAAEYLKQHGIEVRL